MGEIWIFFIQIHKKDKNIISKLLSMNFAGWNPVKPCNYKQYPYLIKMKEKNEWNWKIEGENEFLQKFWYEKSF